MSYEAVATLNAVVTLNAIVAIEDTLYFLEKKNDLFF